jgi:hypothetical protein
MKFQIIRSSGSGDGLPQDTDDFFRQLNDNLDFYESQIFSADSSFFCSRSQILA